MAGPNNHLPWGLVRPRWNVVQSMSHGATIIDVMNATHAHIEALNATGGAALDSFWLTREALKSDDIKVEVPAARPRFRFPWQRVPTMMQAGMDGRFVRSGNMLGDGRFDDRVIRFIAENYDMIVAGNLQPGRAGCLEPKIKEFADRIAAVNPQATVLVYEANQIHHGALVPPGERPDTQYLCGLDLFREEWIATMDNGTKVTVHGGKQFVHNLSIPAVRQWWIDVVTNETLGTNVHGVFADNGLDSPSLDSPSIAPERGAALLRGQQQLLDEVRASGKYIIFNGIRYAGVHADGSVRDDFAALDVLLPHASAGYCEPWCTRPLAHGPSRWAADGSALQALRIDVSQYDDGEAERRRRHARAAEDDQRLEGAA